MKRKQRRIEQERQEQARLAEIARLADEQARDDTDRVRRSGQTFNSVWGARRSGRFN